MKKRLSVIIALFLIPVLFLSGCFFEKSEIKTTIHNRTGLDVSKGHVLLYITPEIKEDTDITFSTIIFTEGKRIDQQFENNSLFLPLPLSDEIIELLCQLEGLTDENGELLIPLAENGYYSIQYNNDGSASTQDDDFSGVSLNVTLYDADTRILYYFDYKG